MIPKKIWFTWFGSEIPDFAKFSMDTFQEVNPDFKIEMIHRSSNEIDDIFYNKSVKLSPIDSLIKLHLNIIFERMLRSKKRIPICCYFNDSFRLGLISQFGGIYLDCDMFPLRPFDDELLKHRYFNSKRIHIKNNKPNVLIEANFCGSFKGALINKPDIVGCIEETKYKTQELQNKFYSLKLKYGERYTPLDSNNYVEHYGQWYWNPDKCKVKKTKIDEELEDKLKLNIHFVPE